MPKRLLAAFALIIVIIIGLYFFITKPPSPIRSENINSSSNSTGDDSSLKSFNKKQFSLKDPTSLWIIVNKPNPIPIDYVPTDLIVPDVRLRLAASEQQMKFAKRAEPNLIKMFKAAGTEGVNLVFGSGYRSGSLQQQFYSSYVYKDGQAAADRYSARPGHSEHQTGLSVDITSPSGKCHLEICWKDTPEGKWLAKNSFKYGFIIRYPNGKEQVTGYQYEPWHIRYVGVDLANQLHAANQTLEEFFELGPAANY